MYYVFYVILDKKPLCKWKCQKKKNDKSFIFTSIFFGRDDDIVFEMATVKPLNIPGSQLRDYSSQFTIHFFQVHVLCGPDNTTFRYLEFSWVIPTVKKIESLLYTFGFTIELVRIKMKMFFFYLESIFGNWEYIYV